MQSSSSQKLLIGILVLAVIGFVAFKFMGSADTTSEIVTTETGQEDVGQQILDAVDKLNTVNIDGSLFTSSLFTNLKDFSTDISSEQQGRQNPFADIGSGGGYSNQSAAATQANTSTNKSTVSSPASRASQGKSSEI